jgi:hypothetical protein
MMSRIGLPIREALLIANEVLNSYGLRDDLSSSQQRKYLPLMMYWSFFVIRQTLSILPEDL